MIFEGIRLWMLKGVLYTFGDMFILYAKHASTFCAIGCGFALIILGPTHNAVHGVVVAGCRTGIGGI
jgi:hypothetical protein